VRRLSQDTDERVKHLEERKEEAKEFKIKKV
jgi:hypothetical protein